MTPTNQDAGANIYYWRKDGPSSNFGDYLNRYFANNILGAPKQYADQYLLIGSVLSKRLFDMLETRRNQTVVWGAGIRSTRPLKKRLMKNMIFTAVRGYRSANTLGLGDIPVGDPGLLMPHFYHPGKNTETGGKTVIVPHFYQSDIDDRYFTLYDRGAVVVRPNIVASDAAAEHLIDLIASSDRIATNSLHAAVIACAYRIPCVIKKFGYLDCPIKWDDFFSVFGITVEFDKNDEFRVPPIPESTQRLVCDRLLAVCPFTTNAL